MPPPRTRSRPACCTGRVLPGGEDRPFRRRLPHRRRMGPGRPVPPRLRGLGGGDGRRSPGGDRPHQRQSRAAAAWYRDRYGIPVHASAEAAAEFERAPDFLLGEDTDTVHGLRAIPIPGAAAGETAFLSPEGWLFLGDAVITWRARGWRSCRKSTAAARRRTGPRSRNCSTMSSPSSVSPMERLCAARPGNGCGRSSTKNDPSIMTSPSSLCVRCLSGLLLLAFAASLPAQTPAPAASDDSDSVAGGPLPGVSEGPRLRAPPDSPGAAHRAAARRDRKRRSTPSSRGWSRTKSARATPPSSPGPASPTGRRT